MPSKPDVIKERRKNDPEYVERVREYGRKYRERNLDTEKERNRIAAAKKRYESRESYNAYMRDWRERNKDRINTESRERLLTDIEYAEKIRERERVRYAADPEGHRNIRLKSVYGITLSDYMKMYLEQNGKCAICSSGKPDKGKDGLVVDHCHKEGHVRKLLCTHCNKGLGLFKDDVELLANAIDYLKKGIK